MAALNNFGRSLVGLPPSGQSAKSPEKLIVLGNTYDYDSSTVAGSVIKSVDSTVYYLVPSAVGISGNIGGEATVGAGVNYTESEGPMYNWRTGKTSKVKSTNISGGIGPEAGASAGMGGSVVVVFGASSTESISGPSYSGGIDADLVVGGGGGVALSTSVSHDPSAGNGLYVDPVSGHYVTSYSLTGTGSLGLGGGFSLTYSPPSLNSTSVKGW